jgi:hypothetical protein
MNDDQTAWSYVRHDEIAREHSASSSPAWWKICDGQSEQVTEADVLSDLNVVHFLVYTRHEGNDPDTKSDTVNEASMQETTAIEQDDADKPKKTIRLDSVLDWWTSTPLVVSSQSPFLFDLDVLTDNFRNASRWIMLLLVMHLHGKYEIVMSKNNEGTTPSKQQCLMIPSFLSSSLCRNQDLSTCTIVPNKASLIVFTKGRGKDCV